MVRAWAGIDRPHVATCVRCRLTIEWFGYRREVGRDTREGFVCLTCLRKEKGVASGG